MNGKNVTKGRQFDIVMGIIMQVMLFFPWFTTETGKYNAATYLYRILTADNVNNLIRQDFSKTIEYLNSSMSMLTGLIKAQMIILLTVQSILLVRLLLSFWKKVNNTLPGALIVLITASIMFFGSTGVDAVEGMSVTVYCVILCFVLGAWFLTGKMIDEWDEATRLEKIAKAEQKAFKKERKERLKFEGRYNPLFYHIIWKNFLGSWKDYTLLVISGILASGLIFSGFAIQSILKTDSGEDSLLLGQGIETILLNFLVVIFLLSAFLITFLLLFYIRRRISGYGMLLTLGIRRRTMFLFCGLELVVSQVLSILGGLVLGNIIVLIFRNIIQMFSEHTLKLGNVNGGAYVYTVLGTVGIFIVSLMATHDIFLETSLSAARNSAVAKEKAAGKLCWFGFLLGFPIAGYAIARFSERRAAEGILNIVIFLLGLYLILKNGWNIWLLLRKKYINIYLKNLVAGNAFYHKFRTSIRYIFVFVVVQFAALYIFNMQTVSNKIAESPETLFPYDFVCLANEADQPLFEEIQKKYDTKVQSFPMVRTATVDNTEAPNDYRECVIPQGQHIGISESTYRELKRLVGEKPREDLNLDKDGDNIYIVYQQDKATKAHPIDFFFDRKTPYVHIGQPVLLYGWIFREEIFPPRIVAGEEQSSLTGAFREGKYESLIVFSDEYFEKVSKTEVDGPRELMLLTVPEKYHDKVQEQLKKLSEAHKVDESYNALVKSVYSAKANEEQIASQRIMGQSVNLFVILMLLVVNLFVMHIKWTSELTDYQAKYAFLQCIGMRKKERVSTLRKEMRTFLIAPFITAAVCVCTFTAITWRLRGFNHTDILNYIKYAGLISIIYMIVVVLDFLFIQHTVIKKVEG